MKRTLLSGLPFGTMKGFCFIITFCLAIGKLYAQAPNINYGGDQTYLVQTQITPLTPSSSLVAPLSYSSTAIGSGFHVPVGVAVDAAGNVYVADQNDNAIKKVPAAGGTPVSAVTINAPDFVAINSAGDIFITCANDFNVYKVAAGTSTPVVYSTGYNYPAGMKLDAAGNLYVADAVASAVYTIPANGSAGISLGTGFKNPNGIDDFLQIDKIGQYLDNKVTIMNRNGQLVYERKHNDKTSKVFDGHSSKNGRMQLPGAYFYQLDYMANGVARHKTGYIVLKY